MVTLVLVPPYTADGSSCDKLQGRVGSQQRDGYSNEGVLHSTLGEHREQARWGSWQGVVGGEFGLREKALCEVLGRLQSLSTLTAKTPAKLL